MATPSFEGYKMSGLANMGNTGAIQDMMNETPSPNFNMFDTGTTQTTQTTPNLGSNALDKEVEIGLGISVGYPMSDREKQDYVDSLSSKEYQQMLKYKNEGYSFEASKTLLENSKGLKDPTAKGTAKYEDKPSFFQNLIGGAGDSATGIGMFLGKGAADIIGRTAKKLGADEDRVNYLVNDFKNYLEDSKISKSVGADTDSATYKITKGVGDITQTIAGEKIAENALKGTQLASKATQLKNSGLLGKMAVGAAEGAADMGLYDIISEGELPSGKDLGIGAGVGAIIPAAGVGIKALGKFAKKGAGKVASKLELSGMLNPSKIERVKNMLIEEGTDLAGAGLKGGTAEDVGNWMIQRSMKGTKEEIIGQLGNHSKKAREFKLSTLAKSKTTHNVEAADGILQAVDNVIKDIPGLEQKSARVQELLNKQGQYSLLELDEIKTIGDDILDLYTNAGEPKAGAVKKGLVNLRNELKTYIEDAATAEGLGNIKMLNNEIQVAKALEKGISAKDSADMAREMLSIFSKGTIGGAIGAYKGPFDSDTLGGRIGNVLIGALAGQVIFSTKAKTNLAAMIDKRISKGAKVELEKWLGGEVKTLSKKTEQELFNILQDVEATPIEILGNGNFTNEEAQAIIDYIQPSLFE